MRAAPAVSVSLQPSAHWRRATLLLALVAVLAVAAWALQRRDGFAALAACGVLALAAPVVWRRRQPPPQRLRWDGQGWWLQARPEPAEPLAGEVSVAIDLGAGLLLRFDAAPGARPRRVWLPLQRAGQGTDWHALRCALYSPRPAAAPPAATDPSP